MPDARKFSLEQRYRALRAVARQAVMEEYRDVAIPNLRLAEIGEEALNAAIAWKDRRVNWDWARLVDRLRRRPRRVELAIWVDPFLCGLALGKVSDSRVVARIDRIERAPHDAHLVGFIAEIATSYLETCGVLAGCGIAVISEPAPELIAFYKELGYTKEIIKRGKIIGLQKSLSIR